MAILWYERAVCSLLFKFLFCFALYIYIYTYIFFLWLTLCSYISLEIMFVNLLTSTKWRSVIFSLFTLLILLNSHKINFSLRYRFPWFSFFSLEGLEWALPDIFSLWHHTSKFALLQNGFPFMYWPTCIFHDIFK